MALHRKQGRSKGPVEVLVMDETRVSKLLSYVLRHRPDDIGIVLDPEGWTDVEVLLRRLRERKQVDLDLEGLRRIVTNDPKGRYSLDADRRIRANQGHTLAEVRAVDRTPRTPPDRLYHGTTAERWAAIEGSGGLRKMQRHHVHLSADHDTARTVGARHRRETPVVLEVDAAAMAADGHIFLCSENGVWLTDDVPTRYLRLL